MNCIYYYRLVKLISELVGECYCSRLWVPDSVFVVSSPQRNSPASIQWHCTELVQDLS